MSLSDQLIQADDAASTPSAPGSLSAQLTQAAQAAQPPVNPYSPVGTTAQNFWAGAGKSTSDVGRGIKQLSDIPAVWLEKQFPGLKKWDDALGLPSAQASADATQANIDESKRHDAPLIGTGAGMAGNIAGNVATMVVPAGLLAKFGPPGAAIIANPTTYKAAAGVGALQGFLQPTSDGDSRALNTIVGGGAGVAGNAAVNAIGRIAQPVANALSPLAQKAVQVLQDAGVPLDAAQRSGSALLNRIRSSFSDNPFTAGPQSEANAAQQQAYNRAVLATMGEPGAAAATPDVMSRAGSRINGVFKNILENNDIQIPHPSMVNIAQVLQSAEDEGVKAVSGLAGRVLDKISPDGTIPGQSIYAIKKDVDRLASSSDLNLAYHARQLRSTIMDTINDSLSDADKAAFSQARQQFSNLKRIEPAIDRTGGGNISAPKLANIMAQKANRGASIYGRGDQSLVDLAQAGNLLLGDKMPNSGTAARVAMQTILPLTGAAAGGAADAVNGNYSEAMEKAAMGAAAVYAIPRSIQAAIKIPAVSNYMVNGTSSVPLRTLLMTAPQNQSLLGGTLRRLLPAASEVPQ